MALNDTLRAFLIELTGKPLYEWTCIIGCETNNFNREPQYTYELRGNQVLAHSVLHISAVKKGVRQPPPHVAEFEDPETARAFAEALQDRMREHGLDVTVEGLGNR